MNPPYLVETTDEGFVIHTTKGSRVAEFTTTPLSKGVVVFTSLEKDTKVYYSQSKVSLKLLTFLKTLYPLVDYFIEHVVCGPRANVPAEQKMHWVMAVGKTRFFSSGTFLRWQPPKSVRAVTVTTRLDVDTVRITALEARAFDQLKACAVE